MWRLERVASLVGESQDAQIDVDALRQQFAGDCRRSSDNESKVLVSRYCRFPRADPKRSIDINPLCSDSYFRLTQIAPTSR